jgi:hypothetical protein
VISSLDILNLINNWWWKFPRLKVWYPRSGSVENTASGTFGHWNANCLHVHAGWAMVRSVECKNASPNLLRTSGYWEGWYISWCRSEAPCRCIHVPAGRNDCEHS